MTGLKELTAEITKSATIQPSFKPLHFILALIIFDEKKMGIGRYKLKKDLDLTEGQVKSLLERMKKMGLIEINSRKSGHIISQEGTKLIIELSKLLTSPKPPLFKYEDLTVGEIAYFSVVFDSSELLAQRDVLAQRDAAKFIGGTGATSLIYKNGKFIYPSDTGKFYPNITPKDLEISPPIKENDVLVIGTGEKENIARLATLAAALTLVNF